MDCSADISVGISIVFYNQILSQVFGAKLLRIKFVFGDNLYLTSEIDIEGSYQGDELYTWNYKTKEKPILIFSGGYADNTFVSNKGYIIAEVKKNPSEHAIVAYNPVSKEKQIFDISHGIFFYYNEFEKSIVFYKCNPTSSENITKKLSF